MCQVYFFWSFRPVPAVSVTVVPPVVGGPSPAVPSGCRRSSWYGRSLSCWFLAFSMLCQCLKYSSCKLHLTHWPLGDFNKIIFKLILLADGCDISNEIALRWTSLDLSDDKSTLVQVMAWCRQATSHYLIQCWPRSLPPYGVTRPKWPH